MHPERNGHLQKVVEGALAGGSPPAQIMVGLPVGPDGAITPVPWQAAICWELEQIRAALVNLAPKVEP